jgi:pyruvate formate lyase activating enzyme
MNAPSALVFSVHRLSTDDGPGLRDTFFLKGCSLRCAWCHNPESFSASPEIWWLSQRCIGARDCVRDCPEQALTLSEAGLVIDRQCCTGCGLCVPACPSMAIESLGHSWTIGQMITEAMKERFFYQNSGGGVTVSGGEPCLQAQIVAPFFAACHEQAIHTALDTCGFPPWDDWEPVLEHTDLVLYDLKESDPQRHQMFTGVSNERIWANFKRLVEYQEVHHDRPAIWVRTPLIPDYTATTENISAIGGFLAQTIGERLERWELCAFNNTCQAKYDKLGLDWPLKGKPLLDRELGERLLQTARRSLRRPATVQLTGLI